MRPKDLDFPFSWEQRRPVWYKGVLVVPKYYANHHEWTEEELFSSQKPLHIEYCSGNGDWVIEKAKAHPDQQWVAVEKRFDRVRKIWSKRENGKIDNLLIVCGKAEEFTQFYLPPGSAQEVYINFPDPWPKQKHAKHRLIQPQFIEQLARAVRPSGGFTFVTDDATYSHWMIEKMQNQKPHRPWEFAFEAPHYLSTWEGYGTSWFENLWREKGRQFYYIRCNRV